MDHTITAPLKAPVSKCHTSRRSPHQQSSDQVGRALHLQVSHVGMNGNVAELQVSEMKINSINLRFEDRNTGEVREEGKTRPEVVLRQLRSTPGQVGYAPPCLSRHAIEMNWTFQFAHEA